MPGDGDLGHAIMTAVVLVLDWAVTIGVFVFFVYALVRFFTRPSRRAPLPPDALELLRQRYARGEIDDAEYEHRRKTLTTA